MLIACVLQLEHVLYKGRDLSLFCSILYPQHLEYDWSMVDAQ